MNVCLLAVHGRGGLGVSYAVACFLFVSKCSLWCDVTKEKDFLVYKGT